MNKQELKRQTHLKQGKLLSSGERLASGVASRKIEMLAIEGWSGVGGVFKRWPAMGWLIGELDDMGV